MVMNRSLEVKRATRLNWKPMWHPMALHKEFDEAVYLLLTSGAMSIACLSMVHL